MKAFQLVISNWLDSVGHHFGVPMTLEEDGHCVIPCKDNMCCIVDVPAETEVPSVFIYFPLLKLPSEHNLLQTVLSQALELNLFGLLSGGCHIALDARSQYIVLSFASRIEALDESKFHYVMNDMIRTSYSLRDRLNDIEENFYNNKNTKKYSMQH
ncbi:CesT family type III secretion system chaperone [Vibrio sp. S4M6]|uniref:CesT family type III secretion system chaperone n=1 Tax=Vibrio sinus TaxID=2946865 RepID=UPI00202A1B9C|nr:CesT family type III secretion system chaperone [Vibrio sinus]MCL9783813.1 CesT family type III secretion system chaperone [Vibrio sinus]